MNDAADAVMAAVEGIQPLIEAAEGQRRAMEERGWSPTAAEAFALELLMGWTRLVFKGQS